MDYEENFDELAGIGTSTKKGGAAHDDDEFGDDEGFNFEDDADLFGDDFKFGGDEEEY